MYIDGSALQAGKPCARENATPAFSKVSGIQGNEAKAKFRRAHVSLKKMTDNFRPDHFAMRQKERGCMNDEGYQLLLRALPRAVEKARRAFNENQPFFTDAQRGLYQRILERQICRAEESRIFYHQVRTAVELRVN